VVRPNAPREANRIKVKIGIFIRGPIAPHVIMSKPKTIETERTSETFEEKQLQIHNPAWAPQQNRSLLRGDRLPGEVVSSRPPMLKVRSEIGPCRRAIRGHLVLPKKMCARPKKPKVIDYGHVWRGVARFCLAPTSKRGRAYATRLHGSVEGSPRLRTLQALRGWGPQRHNFRRASSPLSAGPCKQSPLAAQPQARIYASLPIELLTR